MSTYKLRYNPWDYATSGATSYFYTTTSASTFTEPLRVVVEREPDPEPVKTEPTDPIEWLRGRVDEITDLIAA